jgi:hypothetical protein
MVAIGNPLGLQTTVAGQPEASGRELIVIGNQRPAGSAGVYESEPYRILAAETLSYWHEPITDIKGADMPVPAMGDFNDELFSRSLTEYALSTTQAAKILNARSPRFFNLMWAGARPAARHPLLRQFRQPAGPVPGLAPLLERGAHLSVALERCASRRFRRWWPRRLSGAPPLRPPRAAVGPTGFSDHYPIAGVLHEG